MLYPYAMQQEQNKFGVLSKEYRLARRGYPSELYSYIRLLAPDPAAKVLDLGCGTGISTRELKTAGFDVIGLDKESLMIDIASQDSRGIEYTVSSVEKMPFPDASFDVVTAFTAFHWFDGDVAVQEIMRVLKPGGIFCAAFKNPLAIRMSSSEKKAYDAIFQKYVGDRYLSAKNHHPDETLEKHGFEHVEEREFAMIEQYNTDESLGLIQSLSCWNLVSLDRQLEMLGEFRALFDEKMGGLIIHDEPVYVVSGFKK